VSKSDLTEIVNEYVCVSNGVVHHCKVQWVASEPSFGRRGVYLAAVEVVPEHDGSKTVHLMFQRSISRDALLKLLDDAVATSTCERVAQGA
jgi:hypothetical protein